MIYYPYRLHANLGGLPLMPLSHIVFSTYVTHHTTLWNEILPLSAFRPLLTFPSDTGLHYTNLWHYTLESQMPVEIDFSSHKPWSVIFTRWNRWRRSTEILLNIQVWCEVHFKVTAACAMHSLSLTVRLSSGRKATHCLAISTCQF